MGNSNDFILPIWCPVSATSITVWIFAPLISPIVQAEAEANRSIALQANRQLASSVVAAFVEGLNSEKSRHPNSRPTAQENSNPSTDYGLYLD